MQARKQLTARDLQVQELEEQNAVLQERVQDLENQLQRVREEDEAAHNLFRCEHELDQTRQEKERLVIDLEKAKKVSGGGWPWVGRSVGGVTKIGGGGGGGTKIDGGTKMGGKMEVGGQRCGGGGGGGARRGEAHLLSATVRVYSLAAPCRLPDLTSLALLGSVSGQPGLSRGPLPGYKRVSKWRLQLQDSIPFLLLSQKLCTTLHTSASLGCYLLFTHMPDCPLAPLGQVWQQ